MIILLKKVLILLVCLSGLIVAIPNDVESYEGSECFQILNSAELELSDKQMNNACEDIIKTGEAYIEDFRDRGLLIKFIELGDTVSIPLF